MRKQNIREECIYTNSVFCYPSKRKCDTCGWNPEVAERRSAKIMEQLKGGTQIEKP